MLELLLVVVDHRRLLVVVVIVLVILMATTVSSSQRNMTVRSLCVIVAVALSKMRNPTILYRLEKRKKLILHLIMLKKKWPADDKNQQRRHNKYGGNFQLKLWLDDTAERLLKYIEHRQHKQHKQQRSYLADMFRVSTFLTCVWLYRD